MNQILTLIARIVSILTYPLFMPTYAIIIAFTQTYLRLLPGNTLITVLLVTIGITIMLPVIAIYLLYAKGRITDPVLNLRKERNIPLALSAMCYLGLAGYLWKIHAPGWVTAFMLGAAAVTAIFLIINLVWKISGHSAGLGGLTALAIFLCYKGYAFTGLWLPITVIIIAGVVTTSRLLLARHTLSQVAAGFFLSFVVIYTSLLVANV